MCISCLNNSFQKVNHSVHNSGRRSLLKAAGLASAGGLVAMMGVAHAKSTPPKPANVLTPEQALSRLMDGNARYVKGDSLAVNFNDTRDVLSRGQNPYACLVSCADSRVSPELCFDESRGDLFVTRVAGNFVNTDILASLEYATAVLNAPLIMVLGHTSCGAIGAAVKAYTENVSYPGHIQSLTTALAPAVREASRKTKGDDLLSTATADNVRLNVIKLKESNPILSERVSKGSLMIVGGIYDLPTGRVNLI